MSNWTYRKNNSNNNNNIDDDDDSSNKNCLFRTIISMPIQVDYKYRHVISEKWNDCSLFIANRKLDGNIIQIAAYVSVSVCANNRIWLKWRAEERATQRVVNISAAHSMRQKYPVYRMCSLFNRPKTVRFWIIFYKARTIWGKYWGQFQKPIILLMPKPNKIAKILEQLNGPTEHQSASPLFSL